MKIIRTIIDNLRQPKYRLLYRKSCNETNCYILLNPSHLLGNNKVQYSNKFWRQEFGLGSAKGFKALTPNGVRSFDYHKIIHLSRVGLLEAVE